MKKQNLDHILRANPYDALELRAKRQRKALSRSKLALKLLAFSKLLSIAFQVFKDF